MALINCPECGKEISDKVKSCPHCGYPMEYGDETTSVVTQPAESTPVNNTERKNKIINGTIIGAIAVIAVVAIIFAVYSCIASNSRTTYIENLRLAQSTMLTSGAEAESLCNLTKSVWYNTIYEKSDPATDKYTKVGFYSDFNNALQKLFSDEETQDSMASIRIRQDKVSEIMKSLQKPPKDLVPCYETVNKMYECYQGLTSLAISPTGNLKDYLS